MDKTFKISLLTVSAMIIATSSYFVFNRSGGDDENSSARFLSLGTPRALELDTKKEMKVLLADPAIAKNWGLMGTKGVSDVDVVKAWEITQGSRDIVVAVIDTGVDATHPDLKKNLWRNPGETGFDKNGKDRATNKIDDDGNGMVDDVHGWNFVVDNNDLTDRHGHGTHIAGIVGAEGGNGIGISGVAPQVSLMILKYYDPYAKANDNLKNTIRAIRYAISKKVHIINYSGGGIEYSSEEHAAVKAARDAGILFVAAAGNEKSNSDTAKYYPADYTLDNIISVTAINPDAQVLATSNYGEETVHIAAPGEGIFSTLPGGKFGLMTGTSQATAFVSGVAALILSSNREFNYGHVRKQILSTSDEISSLRAKTKTSGKLNSYRALVTLSENVGASGIPTKSAANQGRTFSTDPQVRPTETAVSTANFILNALQRKPADKPDPATNN